MFVLWTFLGFSIDNIFIVVSYLPFLFRPLAFTSAMIFGSLPVLFLSLIYPYLFISHITLQFSYLQQSIGTND